MALFRALREVGIQLGSTERKQTIETALSLVYNVLMLGAEALGRFTDSTG